MTSGNLVGETRTAHPSQLRRLLRRPVVGDVVTTVVAVWLAVIESVDNPRLGPFAPWLNLTVGVVVALTLLARRRAPEVVLAVCLAAHAFHLSGFSVFFALYAEGAYRGPRQRRVVALAAVVSLATLLAESGFLWRQPERLLSQQSLAFVLVVLVPLLFGMYVGERRAVLRAWVDRAERAEREQTLIADAAVAEERRRIAGEMHDVVSHQVSLMVVHANALQYVAEDPAAAKEASNTIADAGRQALNELREMIGVLRRPQSEDERRSPDGVAAAPGTEAAPGAASQSASASASTSASALTSASTSAEPGAPAPPSETEAVPGPSAGSGGTRPALSRVPELIASSRSAGLPVEARTTGQARSLPDSTERAAYRIVQEALTNVHKHAPGAETEVAVVYRDETVRVSVRNEAPPEERAGRGTASDGTPLLPSGGHGLIGLRERVRLAGGGIETGPRPGGGFLVVAELPAAPGAAAAAGTDTGGDGGGDSGDSAEA
ncbi:sensor histidine kinase [Streptomyces sp. NHF165]|uniref:sensor histidine kinase n=1 Tax=Streptomyces sp. NHF165 TaxID=2175864 RepID=UPI001F45466D|nr:histidine kinase [Streptomyces sp. NHF165]